MATIKMSSPWVVYYREINELFKYDDEVHVIYDDEERNIKLYVENADKADALSQLLPAEKQFGNVTVRIEIIPANEVLKSRREDLFERAFLGNEVFSYVKTIQMPFMTNTITYVVFENEVVQYFTDNLADINGVTSTLYQYIAKDVFDEIDGVFYCTDVECENRFGMPLGEWP